MNQPNQPPKSAEEVLREIVPTNCIWEDMGNLTNTPIEYVTEAMQTYASQFARYVPDEEIDAMWPVTHAPANEYRNEAAKAMRDMIFNNVKPK